MQFAQDAEPMRWVKSAIGNVVAALKFDCGSVMLYWNIPYRDTPENHCTNNPDWHSGLKTKWNDKISDRDAATIQSRYGR